MISVGTGEMLLEVTCFEGPVSVTFWRGWRKKNWLPVKCSTRVSSLLSDEQWLLYFASLWLPLCNVDTYHWSAGRDLAVGRWNVRQHNALCRYRTKHVCIFMFTFIGRILALFIPCMEMLFADIRIQSVLHPVRILLNSTDGSFHMSKQRRSVVLSQHHRLVVLRL
jgi:hypothetical protein